VRADHVEDRGLEVGAVEPLDRVHEKGRRGLPRARADDEHGARVGMEQHRHVRRDRLVRAAVRALPPAVDLERGRAAAAQHREVPERPFARRHERLAGTREEIVGKPRA
jgi:hypothetical protein